VGYTSQDERVVGKLEETVGQPFGIAYMNDGFFVFDVVSLARMKYIKF
jgi:hypothetical protein